MSGYSKEEATIARTLLALVVGFGLFALLTGCEGGDTARSIAKLEAQQRHPQCSYGGNYIEAVGAFYSCAAYHEIKRLNDNLEAGE